VRPRLRSIVLLAVTSCGARSGLELDERPGIRTCEATIGEVCNGLDDDCDGRVDEELPFGLVSGPFEVALEPTGYFTSDLVAVRDGFVSVWNVGFDGSRPPRTNAFARHLDRDARPDGEPLPILERPVTMGLTVAPSPRGLVLTYCGRFGADDRAASAFLDARGEPLGGEIRRGDGARSCGAVPQAGLHTGRRHLFAFLTNGPDVSGMFPAFLDVADDTGASLEGRTVEPRGDLYTAPGLAVSGGVVGLLVARRPDVRTVALDLHRLALDGRPLGPPVLVGESSVDVVSYAHGQLVGDGDGGFLIVASDSFRAGVHAARVGPDGSLISPLEPIHAGWQLSELDLAPLPGGGAVLVGNDFTPPSSSAIVARLDTSGAIEAVWEGRDAVPYFLVPAVEVASGRIFVQSAQVDGTQLEIREFGCRP